MARVEAVNFAGRSLVIGQDKDFSSAILLAKATGVCGDKLEKLLDAKRDSKKLWQKILSLKEGFLTQIVALEVEIKNARQNKAKFTIKANPRLFEHFEKNEQAKIKDHNEAVDELISKLSELQNDCFGEKTKEHAAIQAEIERLKGRKLQFSFPIVAKPQKAPIKLKPQSEYNNFRYRYKAPAPTQSSNFEPQWWWVAPIILAAPAVVLVW
jgi:hypothetical protein